MSQINIMLYEQLAGLILDIIWAKQFSTQFSLSIGTLHTVCVHLLGASFERS